MKLAPTLTALFIATSGVASADTRIDALCGEGHINEMVSAQDVTANPDGYFIKSLQTQISHGDMRLIKASTRGFHLCTRSMATPEMDTAMAMLLMDEVDVKYLFVPTDTCPDKPNS